MTNDPRAAGASTKPSTFAAWIRQLQHSHHPDYRNVEHVTLLVEAVTRDPLFNEVHEWQDCKELLWMRATRFYQGDAERRDRFLITAKRIWAEYNEYQYRWRVEWASRDQSQ